MFDRMLDNIFRKYSNMDNFSKLLSIYNLVEIQKLNDYLSLNYDHIINIQVYDYEFVNDKIYLRTELGTFLLDRPKMDENKIIDRLSKIVGTRRNLLDFFSMLYHNNIFCDSYSKKYDREVLVEKDCSGKRIISSNLILKDYLEYYFIYRMLIDPEYGKRLFINYNKKFEEYNHLIPLEYLNNPNFNYYVYTSEKCAKYLMSLYDKHYCFNRNLSLVFSSIIVGGCYDKLSFIREYIDEFKQFVLEEATSKFISGKYAILAYKFLMDTNLISLFTEIEILRLYKKEPRYSFKFLGEFLTPIIRGIKNGSPIIKLNRNGNKIVHVKYRDYDLYEGIPVAKIKLESKSRGVDFFDYFIYNNEVVSKLYNMYYKSYKKMIKEDKGKDNLEDFIRVLFHPNNLINIFGNRKFSWMDLKSLSSFSNYYGQQSSENIKQITEILRKRSLEFYNDIVRAKDSLEKLDNCINKLGLDKKDFYDYIINEKFLYAKEKSGLLKIADQYYGDHLKVLDILLLLDEMVTREMTLDEILREKEILRKDFQKKYDQALVDNPMLHQCIFEALNENKRRGYLKLIRLGYEVLEMEISSLEEYSKKFGEIISFYGLLSRLNRTEIYSRLLEKASYWKDFNACLVKKKCLEKKGV